MKNNSFEYDHKKEASEKDATKKTPNDALFLGQIEIKWVGLLFCTCLLNCFLIELTCHVNEFQQFE